MPIKSFDQLYNEITSEDPERAVHLAQLDQQMKASVLLSNLREREGYTQKELAQRVGKSQATIARIESGSMNVTFDTLADIVNHLGYKIEFNIVPVD
ncbi:helix-turn-helix transcriptional regulator [Lentilactobacillus diolivorans]|uniref:transcriptional regulator n=1 Tax=Lentilactobacillus diolivorans TaxID=179838 RepID=UPI0024697EBC|nr:helix-turn-helix transcriptional regulator [Lentilactobacillus diolivorans]MDH5107078.1 helix-turn-helix transcriptional regulator [Lentilactobacillus diolivorans]